MEHGSGLASRQQGKKIWTYGVATDVGASFFSKQHQSHCAATMVVIFSTEFRTISSELRNLKAAKTAPESVPSMDRIHR